MSDNTYPRPIDRKDVKPGDKITATRSWGWPNDVVHTTTGVVSKIEDNGAIWLGIPYQTVPLANDPAVSLTLLSREPERIELKAGQRFRGDVGGIIRLVQTGGGTLYIVYQWGMWTLKPLDSYTRKRLETLDGYTLIPDEPEPGAKAGTCSHTCGCVS